MANGNITIRIPCAKSLELLSELIETCPSSGQGYPVWTFRVSNLLAAIYGNESRELATFARITRDRRLKALVVGGGRTPQPPPYQFDRERREGKAHLESLRDLLERCSAPPSSSAATCEVIGDGSVFIVHGQNLGKLVEVKHLLGQLDVEYCVLGDEPNAGQTVIEKFEAHGGTSSYAVVLLTADDSGGSKQSEVVQDRARQNVIFEFGYFCGKLGRHRTAALYKPGVEIPSDLQGFVYIELDSHGAWRYKLADELSSAGYSIDKNAIR